MTSFYGRSLLLSSPSQPPFLGGMISVTASKAMWRIVCCWLNSAVSCRCVQVTITNVSGNHANQYSACNYRKYHSIGRARARSRARSRARVRARARARRKRAREVKEYWSLTSLPLHGPVIFRISWISISTYRSMPQTNPWPLPPPTHVGAKKYWSLTTLSPHGPEIFWISWISISTYGLRPQTDPWPSPPPTHVGAHARELEPPALASRAICWGMYNRPLQL